MGGKNPWSLVIQRVTTNDVDIWVGNLFSKEASPARALVEIEQGDKVIFVQEISHWRRPFQKLSQGVFALVHCPGLQPDTYYKVNFFVQTQVARTLVGDGTFKTLPQAIPSLGQKPFTIGFGSCYSNQDDNGQVSTAYAMLYDKGGDTQPDLTFLIGDQVYLDLGFASMIPFGGFIRRRIANRYAENWRGLSGIFTRGATWMLPDDHEYWNDYPFNDLPILALQSLKIPSVRNTWVTAANDGIDNIQSTRMVEIINIGNDLSICLANLRTQRAGNEFISAAEFTTLVDWAKSLVTPGVLVIQQLLLDPPGQDERNLPSFVEQYVRLIEALAHTGNDILVLSGDVHCGRVASLQLGTKGAHLYEVVSSPLSNLKGIFNGLGAGVANCIPEYFPPIDRVVPSVPKVKVDYYSDFTLSHQAGRRFSNYPRDRTDEHFMTASLSRSGDDIEVVVRAWKLRQIDLASGLPVEGFKQPCRFILKKSVK